MDPEKPACPVHGIREVSTIKGSNAREKWYACAYGDFKKVVSRSNFRGKFLDGISGEISSFGEVISMDVWKKILDSLDNLGEIIAEGGDNMRKRAELELFELGRVVAEEREKQK